MAETDSSAVREHFLAALQRRGEALPPAARALVDARIASLRTHSGSSALTSAPTRAQQASPLVALLNELEGRTPKEAVESAPAPRDLKSAGYFRASLAAVKIEQQLAASLAQQPTNAGPMNSHLLAVQALDSLRATAPAYLHRFVDYLDTLFWLDGAQETSSAGTGKTRGRKKR